MQRSSELHTTEPWASVLGKLTKPMYKIQLGSLWWQPLASHTIMVNGKPLTAVLGAQLNPGSPTFRLELAGKDAGAWNVIRANVPTMHQESGAVQFAYESMWFAWVYHSKSLAFPINLRNPPSAFRSPLPFSHIHVREPGG